jgi:hypothetical protein
MLSNSIRAYTIGGINLLPESQKREIYSRLIPSQIFSRFHLDPSLIDSDGQDLLKLACEEGTTSIEIDLRHEAGFPDPLLYGHFTDTINGQVHILLYIVNDPSSPRFDVDRMPDGTLTNYGTCCRNLEAEVASMRFGLAPGQIRRGLRLLGPAISSFEHFTSRLGHDLYFADPLFYHNAILFERYGFCYEKGRKLMQRIQDGFAAGGDLIKKLDGSTPFRKPEAANSIRLRSWAIYDGLIGEPFTNVTMYKRVDCISGLDSAPGCTW